MDEPGGRRSHARVTPRLGGIGIAVGFYAALASLVLLESSVASLLLSQPTKVLGIVLGGAAMVVLGAVDDVRGLRPSTKLAVQTAVALGAYGLGFRIGAVAIPWVGVLPMGFFEIPITVLWFLGVINALNLIDGLDGLAAGVAFFACVANGVVSFVNGIPLVMLLSASMGGALLGFLRYNFNPARIFMGDSGSMFLGYMLAASSLMGVTVKASTTVALLVPIIALGLPIIDTLLAMVRRALARQSIFAADRGHIHHRLVDLGLTHRRAVLILYGFSVALTLCALGVALGKSWQVGAALAACAMVMMGVVRMAGVFDRWQFTGVGGERRREAVQQLQRGVRQCLVQLADARGPREVDVALQELVRAVPNLSSYDLRRPQGEAQRSLTTAAAREFAVSHGDVTLALAVMVPLHPAQPEVRLLAAMLAEACAERLEGAASRAKTSSRERVSASGIAAASAGR